LKRVDEKSGTGCSPAQPTNSSASARWCGGEIAGDVGASRGERRGWLRGERVWMGLGFLGFGLEPACERKEMLTEEIVWLSGWLRRRRGFRKKEEVDERDGSGWRLGFAFHYELRLAPSPEGL